MEQKVFEPTSFKENTYNKGPHYIAEAYVSPHSDNINTSSILTKLIQEAGRWCRHYASDLFIWWPAALRHMSYDNLSEVGCTTVCLFGFHEDGVDSGTEICNKYNRNDSARYMAKESYRAIWRLDITSELDTESTSGYKNVKLDLYEVQR